MVKLARHTPTNLKVSFSFIHSLTPSLIAVTHFQTHLVLISFLSSTYLHYDRRHKQGNPLLLLSLQTTFSSLILLLSKSDHVLFAISDPEQDEFLISRSVSSHISASLSIILESASNAYFVTYAILPRSLSSSPHVAHITPLLTGMPFLFPPNRSQSR